MMSAHVKHKVLNIALAIVLCIICYQAIKENEAILFGKSSKSTDEDKGSSNKKFLYLTFDDGPNFGSHVVLDAFKSAGGSATFFVNCLRICRCQTKLPEIYYAKGNCTNNQAAVLRMVREGHLLGDHSSDHMAHNHVGKGYHYWSGPRDLKYFGENNLRPIINFLRENGIEEDKLSGVEASMKVIKRMPFTNIWRIPGVSTDSERAGVRKVAGALARAGGQVYGWDMHWGLTWSRQLRREVRHVTGVRGMLKQLRLDMGRMRGKVVFLSHDYNHLHPELATPPLDGKMSPGSEDLAAFLRGAQEQGWIIRTLDTFLTD